MPKLYGIWKSVDDIDFDKLPKSFVLKTNHDCGGVVLVPDKQSFLANKVSFNKSMQKLKEHLATNYYELYKEYHYKDIEPRVFAEELLGANLTATNANQSIENGDFQAKNDITIESNAYNAPDDYKFHCFGKAKSKHIYIQVDTERFTNHTRTIFDLKWQKMDFEFCYQMPSYVPQQPKNFALMLQIAKALSQDLNVRVDLYNPCDCVIVGELTFTHGGGTEKFNPPKWDKRFGEMWE